MDENNTENLDSSIEEAELPEQQPQETKQEFTEREKQYFERIKDLEKKLKDKPLETPKKAAMSVDDKVDLRLEGYSKEDITAIERAMAGRSLEDTLKDPYVKAALDGVRAMRQTEASTPEPSSTIPTFTSDKKTWAQMSQAERKANYAQAIGAVSGGARTRAE